MIDNKHTVATDALATLGTIIDDTQQRDAIHLAVEPVIAARTLRPGDHVGLLENGQAGFTMKPAGIVDPFVRRMIEPGERFWLIVYPRQITSLRHVWEHPSFPATQAVEPTKLTPTAICSKEASELWLRGYLGFTDREDSEDNDGYQYTLRQAVNGGDEYLTVLGRDASGPIPSDFWKHVENVTGKTIPLEKRATYFSCSC